VTLDERYKKNIEGVLDFTVENNLGYLIPLRQLVTTNFKKTPNSIKRRNFKRITTVVADLKEGSDLTALKTAAILEREIFPELRKKFPSTLIEFDGEIKESREAKGDLLFSVLMVIFLIYVVLAVLFNSLFRPLMIMSSIIFGVIGIILAFYFHGIHTFGFFSSIGALGLSGVIVNDSIIMINKLDKNMNWGHIPEDVLRTVVDVVKTRLNAVILTTLTTVAGFMPTAYGIGGHDAFVSRMMLAMTWGLIFATFITLILVPAFYTLYANIRYRLSSR